MRPRLELARRLLRDHGAIFVSIDDNEIALPAAAHGRGVRRGQLLAQVVVNLNAKGRQLGKGFATSHEYLLVYARDARCTVLDASSTEAVDERDFPLTAADGRR